MAPVVAELRSRPPDARHIVVHTGQHYDPLLSDVFIDERGILPPNHALGVGSASHAVQTARLTIRQGTNTLLGLEPERIRDIPGLLATRGPTSPESPPLWDGCATERVVGVIERIGRGKPATSR
jgi:hypothetical protein